MAGSVNKVTLVGNLGKEPDVRRSQDGNKIVNLSIATSETWNDRASGERREKTEWHRVVIFNKGLADVAEKYLRKGSKVYVEGKLQTRKWQGNDGQDRYTTEVVLGPFNSTLVLLDGRGGGNAQRDDDDADGRRTGGGGEFNGGGQTNKYDDLDDEIPFVTRWGLR